MVGEEVLYDDERYVIDRIDPSQPYGYRLLAVSPKGARIVWATEKELAKIRSYTTPVRDTTRV